MFCSAQEYGFGGWSGQLKIDEGRMRESGFVSTRLDRGRRMLVLRTSSWWRRQYKPSPCTRHSRGRPGVALCLAGRRGEITTLRELRVVGVSRLGSGVTLLNLLSTPRVKMCCSGQSTIPPLSPRTSVAYHSSSTVGYPLQVSSLDLLYLFFGYFHHVTQVGQQAVHCNEQLDRNEHIP